MTIKLTEKMALGCLFLQTIQVGATEQTTKPNIILIMTDQQSYNTISALQNTYTATPNINKLVNNGISFTNAFCTNPVSVASRFSIFSGMYGGQYQIRDNQCIDAVQTDVVAMLNQYGMGNIFKNNGYETVYGGKVHLPFAKNTNKFTHPVNYGFSSYLTDDERDGLATTAASYITNRTSTTPLLLVVSFLNPHDICLESSTNLSKNVIVDPSKPEIAATINSVRALADAYDSLYFYQSIAPQLPANYAKTTGFPAKFTPSAFDVFPDYYWRRYRWIYSKLVELVDGHIGKVLDAIDGWAQKNNTIIVFTSDHGEMQGAHHATVKNLPFNECQHVPFIISGKGIVSNQCDSSLICNGTDMIPTLCELAGITIPAGLPGISIAKRALGTATVNKRKFLYLEGDGFSNIIDNQDYKYTQFHITGNPEMMINLSSDPGELVSTTNSNPSKTTELRNILAGVLNTNTATAVHTPGVGNSKLAIVTNPETKIITINEVELNSTIALYDVSGRLILKTIAHKPYILLNTSQLKSGMYIVKNNQQTAKILLN